MSKMEKNLNMTTGNITRLLILFSIPMLIGNIFQQFYNLVDSVIVGRLVGSDALAAIGATGSVTFLFFALCNGIGTGGGIITSQFYGKGDVRYIKKCIVNTGIIMLIFPTIVGVIALCCTRPLLVLLKTPENIMKDACGYMYLMCLGLLFVSLYNFASSMLRAMGDSKTPLYFLIFSCILNAILDFLFVYFFKMGVIGAGIATLISQFISGALCLAYAYKTNDNFHISKSDLHFDPKIAGNIIKIGLPISLQFSLIAISTMALQRVVNSFGAVAVAAFTAVSRIEQVIHQPYQTLSAALSTFTGQNFGARKNKRILEGYYKAMLLMTGFTVIMVCVIQLLARPITAIFVSEKAVIDMGVKAISISSLFYFFLGVIYVVRGVLNGLGDAFFALYNGIIEVVGRFTVPIILTSIPAIGIWGIWWSVGIVWFLSGFTAWLRYISYKKKLYRTFEMKAESEIKADIKDSI